MDRNAYSRRWNVGGSEEEVGGKDSRSKRRERRSNKDAQRILDFCPAIVMLPNPLLDLSAALAAETTVGGSGMLRSFSTKGQGNIYSNDEEAGYHFIWILLDYSTSDAFHTALCPTL